MEAAPSTPEKRSAAPLRHRLPNVLTIARLAVLPVFWVLLAGAPDGQSTAAAVIFIAASVTDWFDGYLARRYHSQSRFGRLADPLADRLLIDSAVILLWWHDRVPLLGMLLILARDVALLLGFRLASKRGYELSVIYLGKTATALLMAGLASIMLTDPSTRWPLYVFNVGLGLALLAGVIYVLTVRGRLRAAVRGEDGT
jgi:CDP-diacylglycerol--glycerol-3-phosphate 3-phosphatidyltransferase